MIRVFWPSKAVPKWLQNIKVDGKPGNYCAKHKGFGMIINQRNTYLVWLFCGTFIHINGNGKSITMTGGAKGVVICNNLYGFLSYLFSR